MKIPKWNFGESGVFFSLFDIIDRLVELWEIVGCDVDIVAANLWLSALKSPW